MSRPGIIARALGWLEDVAAGGKLERDAAEERMAGGPLPPMLREEPADPARVAAWRSLIDVSVRLKREPGPLSMKDARWCGREIARCAHALWTASDRRGIEAAAWAEMGERMRAVLAGDAPRCGKPDPNGRACTLATDHAHPDNHSGEPGPYTAEAERLRAKEAADHAAWLRENAVSVVLPEHPAVALLREMAARGSCPECFQVDVHDEHCALAAILAGSKPGERALADPLAEERELGRQEQHEQHARNLRALEAESQKALVARLAEERANGAAEERAAVCRWMTAEWGTQEDAETNRLIGEVVQDIRDGKHVTPAKPMPIGWTAADEREAIATLLERWPGHEPVAFWRAVEVIRARGQS